MSDHNFTTPAPKSAIPTPVDAAADFILGDRIVAYHVAFARVVGSAMAALLLSQFYYWANNAASRERDGWFYKTGTEITEETGLTRREQETSRRILRDLGVLAEERRGLPAKMWYRVNKERLSHLLRVIPAQPGTPLPGAWPKLPASGFVYLLRTPAGHYKIGKARDIHARLTQLAPALPFPVTLEHQIACDDYTRAERSLHERFASRRLHGEGFGLTEADVTWIKALSHWPGG